MSRKPASLSLNDVVPFRENPLVIKGVRGVCGEIEPGGFRAMVENVVVNHQKQVNGLMFDKDEREICGLPSALYRALNKKDFDYAEIASMDPEIQCSILRYWIRKGVDEIALIDQNWQCFNPELLWKMAPLFMVRHPFLVIWHSDFFGEGSQVVEEAKKACGLSTDTLFAIRSCSFDFSTFSQFSEAEQESIIRCMVSMGEDKIEMLLRHAKGWSLGLIEYLGHQIIVNGYKDLIGSNTDTFSKVEGFLEKISKFIRI